VVRHKGLKTRTPTKPRVQKIDQQRPGSAQQSRPEALIVGLAWQNNDEFQFQYDMFFLELGQAVGVAG